MAFSRCAELLHNHRCAGRRYDPRMLTTHAGHQTLSFTLGAGGRRLPSYHLINTAIYPDFCIINRKYHFHLRTHDAGDVELPILTMLLLSAASEALRFSRDRLGTRRFSSRPSTKYLSSSRYYVLISAGMEERCPVGMPDFSQAFPLNPAT